MLPVLFLLSSRKSNVEIYPSGCYNTPKPIDIILRDGSRVTTADNNSCDTQNNMDTTNNQKNRNTYLLNKTV